jgi:hypothetical protein
MNIQNEIEALQYAQYVHENGYEPIAKELVRNVINKLLEVVDAENREDNGDVSERQVTIQ